MLPDRLNPAPGPNPPWPLADAARQLGVSRRTLERRIADGAIRAIRVGARVLLPDSEVRRIAEYGLNTPITLTN